MKLSLTILVSCALLGKCLGGGLVNPSLSSFSTLNAPVANVATIFTNNTFSYNNVLYGPYANESLTVSNAWQLFSLGGTNFVPGGGVTIFGPGLYQFPTTLVWPPTNYPAQGNTLTIQGAGLSATILINTNLGTPQDLMDLAQTPNLTATVINLFDCTFAVLPNTAGVNVVSMGVFGNNNILGGLAGADIERNLFTCWSSYTNLQMHYSQTNFTPDIVPGSSAFSPPAVVGLNITNGFGDPVKIDHNWFDVVAAVLLANDHGQLTHNVFEDDGGSYGVNLNFQTSSLFYAGFPVIIVGGNGTGNNYNNAWDIGHNEFVNDPAAFLYVGRTRGQGYYIYGLTGNLTIDQDDFEGGAQYIPVCVTYNTHVTFANCYGLQQNQGLLAYYTNAFFDITNTADYSKPMQVDTGMVQVAEWNLGLSGVTFHATNVNNTFTGTFTGTASNLTITGGTITNAFITNSVFAGNGGGLTNVPASSLINGSYTMWIGTNFSYSISGSATNTLLGTLGRGSKTIPANSLAMGSIVSASYAGQITTAAGNITNSWWVDGTNVCNAYGAVSGTGVLQDAGSIFLTVIATNSSLAIVGFSAGSVNGVSGLRQSTPSATYIFDPTAPHTVDLTVSFSSTGAGTADSGWLILMK